MCVCGGDGAGGLTWRVKIEIAPREKPVGLKQTLDFIRHFNLSDSNLSLVLFFLLLFLTEIKKDFGRDMTNA